mmetsp:Transcript_22801/g.47826  ORF Transcript_22801/g.47826 Transcript_22801/m.47826 type:complete len:98 (+) Transcript_22801:1044-1337(+)
MGRQDHRQRGDRGGGRGRWLRAGDDAAAGRGGDARDRDAPDAQPDLRVGGLPPHLVPSANVHGESIVAWRKVVRCAQRNATQPNLVAINNVRRIEFI